MEVDKTRDKMAENSMDTSMVSQHNSNNDNDYIVSSPSPCPDDDNNEEKNFSTFLHRNNFGYLKKAVPDKLKITIIQHGPEKYQNKGSAYAKKDGRPLSQQWFHKVSTNGDSVARKWLVYSPYRKACYYFLFSKDQLSSNFSKEEGFSTWRKLNLRITYHKTSPSNTECMREYLNLAV